MVNHWEKMGRNSRKPILQLDDSRTNTLQPSSSGTSGSSGNNLRGLIHYEDSDDDTTPQGEEESCVSSAGETLPNTNGTKKIDLEVADFLKEIDAMTSNDAQDSSEAEAKDTEDHIEEIETTNSSGVNDQANSTSNILDPPCFWQQCYDETSGYTYFWNTKTNEVTWESPIEYKEYLERARLREAASKSTNLPDPLYVTNGEASTSSAGRVVTNGVSCVVVKNSNKPLKKRTHNREEGKIEPISYFGPPTSDSSDDDSNSKPKKAKVIVEENPPEVLYGPYLPENASPVIDSPPRNEPSASSNVPEENEALDAEESCTSSSSNKNEARAECAMDLTRVVTQSRENDNHSPQIQVGNVSDSETHDSENTQESRSQILPNESSLSRPSTSSEGIQPSTFELNHRVVSEDEPDSTCTSKLERRSKRTKNSRRDHTLPQSLQFISQYEITDGESEGEISQPSPVEVVSNKADPLIDQPEEETNRVEQSSNSSDDLVANPISSEENSLNNFVSDSESRVVPIGSPEENNSREELEPSVSQDEEIDLDEIEKELDRALERKACQSSRNVDSPTPSQRVNDREENYPNAQSVPEENSPEVVPNLSQESLELLSNDILGKLELLTASRARIPLLSTLLIMVEVRLSDWRNGALSSQYFLERLREANHVLGQYETSAVPPGWTCNWDRDERRYFYTHVETGRSQTEFPVENETERTSIAAELEEPDNSEPGTRITYENILTGKHSSAGQHPVVTSSTAEGLFRSVAKSSNKIGSSKISAVQSGEASCSFHVQDEPIQPSTETKNEEEAVPSLPSPPSVQAPPPIEVSHSPRPPSSTPPPLPSPPKSPPPDSYPDSTEAEENELLEPQNAQMEIDTLEDVISENSFPSSSSHHFTVQLNNLISPLVPAVLPLVGTIPNHMLEQEQLAFYESLGSSWMAQPSVPGEISPPTPGVIIVRPPLSNGIEVPAYIAPPLQWPIMPQPPSEPFFFIPETNGTLSLESNGILPPSGSSLELDEVAAGLALAENHNDPLMALPAGPSNAGMSNDSPNPPKKDKKKSKLATGLSLKKKNISSLVEKWQKIKEEQLREEEEVEGRKNSDQDGNISTTQ